MKKSKILFLISALTFTSLTACQNNENNNQNRDDKLTSISCSTTKLELVIGETAKITTTFTPSSTNDLLEYESSNPKVLTVDVNGEVTAHSEGEATITISCVNYPDIKDTLTFTVKGQDVTKFDITLDDSVNKVIEGNTTLYELIVGENYPINIDIEPKTLQNNTISVEFDLDNYCSFDSKTNTLTPLKSKSRLEATFKLMGTKATTKLYFKIQTKGESDSTEVINMFNKSIELEKSTSINGYGFTFKANYYDNGVLKSKEEKTTLNVHKDKNKFYMSGNKEITNKSGMDSVTSELEYLYKGYGTDEYFYDVEVLENGTHVSSPKKKLIVSEGSTSSTTITTNDAITKSKYIEHNSKVGLSAIAKGHINVLPYDYFIPGKSHPYYFGGDGLKRATFSKVDNKITVKTYQIEDKDAVYVNSGVYTFNNNGLLIDLVINNKVYNYADFNLETGKPNENVDTIATYEISYNQKVGELTSETTKLFDTNFLYFTDYTPTLVNKSNEEATTYNVNEIYTLSIKDSAPKFATTTIDDITIIESSDPAVASIQSNNKSIKILKDGESTLTIYSSKEIEKKIKIVTKIPDPTSITAKIDNKTVSGEINATINQAIKNITFEVLPNGASKDINVTVLDNKGTITKESNGSYTFTPTSTGKIIVKANSISKPEISTQITFNVSDASVSILDKIVGKTYKLDDPMTYILSTLKFESKTKATFTSEYYGVPVTYTFTPIYDEATNKIKISNVQCNKTTTELEDFLLDESSTNCLFEIKNNSLITISTDLSKASLTVDYFEMEYENPAAKNITLTEVK